MQLSLKALSGPAEGQTFSLRDGMTIGRQDAAINLPEPRVSMVHARIRQKDGAWRIVDNQSKNGVRDADGNKVAHIDLTEGVRFAIGESQFEVLAHEGSRRASDPKPAPAPAVSPAPAAASAAAAPAPIPETAPGAKNPERDRERSPERKSSRRQAVLWHEALSSFVAAESGKFRDRARPFALFEPALVFEFARGPQVNARWVLGYGPRQIGGATLDLPLWEPDIPPVCFELTPTAEGVLLTSSLPKLVRVNGRGVDRHVLNVGDTIEIRETLIEVDFSE